MARTLYRTAQGAKRVVCAGTVVLVASCSSLRVSHDYDTRFDFSRIKTYTWVPSEPSAGVSGLTIQRVQSAVDRELAAKGYTKSDENPDARIAMHAAVSEKYTVTDRSYGFSYGRHWRYVDAGYVEVDSYEQGTLILDVIDAATNAAVWRGIGTRVVQRNLSPAQREERINEAVEKILAQFPPSAAR
jgi:hypothetical protein